MTDSDDAVQSEQRRRGRGSTAPPMEVLTGAKGLFYAAPLGARLQQIFTHVAGLWKLTVLSFRTLLTTPLEMRAFIYQLDKVGVGSMALAVSTAIFVGMVMCIQFAFTLERYGARDSIGNIVGLSQTRELAPALTALVVGCRVAAGVSAELGAMAVTEQIDAIRALGADPVRKLVVPRLLACIIALPLLTSFALAFSLLSAMLVSASSYGVPMSYFWSSVLNIVKMNDLASGFGKTPFFGFLIAIVGCYFGMQTRGGTEGVGRSTTSAVVFVSVTVLLADAVLTKLFISLF